MNQSKLKITALTITFTKEHTTIGQKTCYISLCFIVTEDFGHIVQPQTPTFPFCKLKPGPSDGINAILLT